MNEYGIKRGLSLWSHQNIINFPAMFYCKFWKKFTAYFFL